MIFLTCFSAITFAHDGHDHGSSLAVMVHLLWFAPLLIVVAVVYSKNFNKNYGINSGNRNSKIGE